MMCQRIGRSPIGNIGLGRNSVSFCRRVPLPPHKITTFIVALVRPCWCLSGKADRIGHSLDKRWSGLVKTTDNRLMPAGARVPKCKYGLSVGTLKPYCGD